MAYARSNPHRFTTTRAGKAEIDEEFNTQTGWINHASRRLDTIETSGISGADDPANAGKVPVTDGYHISWKKVDLSYLTPQSMNDTILQDRSITNRVMGVHSVGSDQLIDNCVVEQKVPHNGLPGIKLKDNSTPLTKLLPPDSSCLIGGSTSANGYWYQCPIDTWQVPTRHPDNGGPWGTSLDVIWHHTANPFDGGKIAGTSIPGNRLQNQTVTAAQMAPQSLTATQIAPQSLNDTLFAPNTVSGRVISDGSLPVSKLSGSLGIQVFALGYIGGDGSILNSTNVRGVTHPNTGVYNIYFNRASRNAHSYSVLITPKSQFQCTFIVTDATQDYFQVAFSRLTDTAPHNTVFYFVVYDC